jgi:hypothetical protein
MSGLNKPEDGSVREVVISSGGRSTNRNHYPPRTLAFLKQIADEKNQKDPSIRTGIEKYDAAVDKWTWVYPKR